MSERHFLDMEPGTPDALLLADMPDSEVGVLGSIESRNIRPADMEVISDWIAASVATTNNTTITISTSAIKHVLRHIFSDNPELEAISDYEISTLVRLLPPRISAVQIGNQSFLGAPNFAFTAGLDQVPICITSLQTLRDSLEKQHIVLDPMAAIILQIVAAFNESSRTKTKQYWTLRLIKKLAEKAEDISVRTFGKIAKITFDPHLEQSNIQIATKITPEIVPDLKGKTAVLINKVTTDSGAVISTDDCSEDGGHFFRSSGSERQIVVFPEDQASYVREAKKQRRLTAKKARELASDIHRLVPEGINPEFLDLTDYSERVIGFEAVKAPVRPKTLDEQSKPWLEPRDSGAIFRIEFSEAEGLKTLHINSIEDLKIVQEILHDALANEMATVQVDVGEISAADGTRLCETVVPSQELIEKIDSAVQRYNHITAESAAPKAKATVIAPTLKDLHESDAEKTPTKSRQLRTSKYLNPGITLKEHQIEGVRWLLEQTDQNRSGCLLADDMGLGKTIQILAFLAELSLDSKLNGKPILLIAPLILIENWIGEIEKFLSHDFLQKKIELHGGVTKLYMQHDKSLNIENITAADFVITTYETFSRHARSLLKIDWSVAILDEAQEIKAPDSAVSRSARAIKADFKIAATGTPVENRLLDAWTLFDFCCHPILGTQAEFAALEATANGVERVREIAKIGKGSEAYLLRREKRDAAKDLPQKHFHEVLHTMTPMQAARENEIAILASQHDASPLKILPMLAALYQFPEMERWRNISPKEALEISPKLKATFEILQQVQSKGEKAIIFAIRTEVLHLLASTFQSLFGLKHCHIVNGESNAQKQSHNRIREFSQHEGFQILVLNTVAAGCGLNIVAANHVIHYGRWWNPAKEDQATDRAYRIGQTKAVHVHYPLLHRPDSLDSGFDIRLHGIAQRKRELQTDFLASSNNEISGHELLNSTIIPGAAQRGTK